MRTLFQLLVSIMTFCSLVVGSDNHLSHDIRGQISLIHASSFDGSFDHSPSTLRYIPQLRLDHQVTDRIRLGFDGALELFANAQGDSLTRSDYDFYRLTLRYDSPATQIRLGLQKINFGPARMLRVLQWFDQLDPRDPLALSPGVWAAMGRYYFENGMNLRLWTMTDAPNTWRDIMSTPSEKPWDTGGRLEYPLPAGTFGITMHSLDVWNASGIKENRLAGDFRMDVVIGIWSEAMFSRVELPSTKIDIITTMAGIDYTFVLGNGLYVALEMLSSNQGSLTNEMQWQVRSLALMSTYTLSLEDGLTAYLYAIQSPDLETQYMPMLGWQHNRGNWLFYLALYDMPETIRGGAMALPAGTGLQLNIAFNH
ncbi:MAG: hypothetical protein U9Q77_11585 [Candidatus Marinimicrobia bacterium]|nr:hypothetical protein [Candidatus Neomarinimicrobiota bacterium]